MQITTTRILLYLIIAAVACFILWYFSQVIGYILGALIVSLVANPLCRKIDNFKIYKGKSLSSGASALITLLLILVLCAGILAVFVPTLVKEVRTLANLDRARVIKNFERPVQQLESVYNAMPIDNGQSFQQFSEENLKKLADTSLLSDFLSGFFNSASDFIAGFFSVFFIAFFFLKDEALLTKKFYELFPAKQRPRVKKALNDSKHQLSSYFTGLLFQFLSVSTLAGLGMWIMGVDNPLLLAVLFGLLNLVPYVGPLIAGVVAIVITATTNLYLDAYTELLPLILKVIGVYAVVQFIDNWFLSNYIFSKSVEAHPLEIFLAILVGATIGGVVGMMVAIPAYAILRILFKELIINFKKSVVVID